MNEKSILKLFCDRATSIAKKNGFDIDVASTWKFRISVHKDIKGKIFTFWGFGDPDKMPYEIDLKIGYPIEPFFPISEPFVDGEDLYTLMFNDSLPENVVHSNVLKSLAHTGVTISFKKDSYEKISREYKAYVKHSYHEYVDSIKANDPERWNNHEQRKQILAPIKQKMDEFQHKLDTECIFKFEFIPRGISTLDEAKIWCDLNSQ